MAHRAAAVIGTLLLFGAGLAHGQPQPDAAAEARAEADALARAQARAVENYRNHQRAAQKAAAAAKPKAVPSRPGPHAARSTGREPTPREQAAALARAQARAVDNYRHHAGLPPLKPPAPPTQVAKRVERLACLSGSEDRHARIGVELVNGRVHYVAYYSKWKPRTCSLEVSRSGGLNRWEDLGARSKVTLVDDKGVLVIDRKQGAVRFTFRDVDRGRYCGMDGKINGTLLVTRGRPSCVVQGVMDGHSG